MIVGRTERGCVEVHAPAKLNLYLEILGKRPDGYHDLESLMVTVNLADTLELRDDPTGRITLECDDPRLPTDGSNLVVKAAERLRSVAGVQRGAAIMLRKRIPWEAGLAGGSSDAASCLVALDALWELNSPRDLLESLAAEIGSDVSFFLHAPAAICRGRGEVVEPIKLPRPLHFVLVCPEFGVSTAEVYRRLAPPGEPRSIADLLTSLKSENTRELGQHFFNRLQPVAEAIEPRLRSVAEALGSLEPPLDGHLMSGSGSAFFGLCRDAGAASHAAQQLETLGLGRVRAVTCGP